MCEATCWPGPKDTAPKQTFCIFDKDHIGYHEDALGNVFTDKPVKIVFQRKKN